MKVRDLISKLNQFEPDLDVVCHSDDESVLAKSGGSPLFEMNDINLVEGTMTRGPDGIPAIKFGKAPGSRKLVFVDITSDF